MLTGRPKTILTIFALAAALPLTSLDVWRVRTATADSDSSAILCVAPEALLILPPPCVKPAPKSDRPSSVGILHADLAQQRIICVRMHSLIGAAITHSPAPSRTSCDYLCRLLI